MKILNCLLLALAISPAWADEAAIRKNLAERLQLSKLDEVNKSPIPGLYEVRVGSDIFYTDEQANYLMQGQLFDTKQRKNLTEERIEKLTAISPKDLPLGDAMVVVRGNGQRKLIVFEDPNCGYCKRFERDLEKINNVTVYTYLYPILGPDSTEKSRNIWCAKDKNKTWQDWMLRNIPPPSASCDVSAITRTLEIGRKFKITGTPTLIFANGTRVPGALKGEDIEKALAEASKAPS
jgi:thiol:disulfide interchange protein DsbC